MKFCAFFTALFAITFFTGCEVIRLNNGKYETTLPGRSDFAAVYGDLIILRLRNPENETGTENGYWDWGGKYSIRDGYLVELDMDRQTARKWNFYYELRRQDNGIRVIDHRAENAYQLHHIPAVPYNKQQNNGNNSAPAAYPAYQ